MGNLTACRAKTSSHLAQQNETWNSTRFSTWLWLEKAETSPPPPNFLPRDVWARRLVKDRKSKSQVVPFANISSILMIIAIMTILLLYIIYIHIYIIVFGPFEAPYQVADSQT